MKYFVLLFVLTVSCISEVDLRTKEIEKDIVLNCILKTGNDTVVVNLSYSKAILSSNTFAPVKNAEIKLYENKIFVGQFQKLDSFAYILPFKVKSGYKYKIESICGEKTIWAETKVPEKINVIITSINNTHNSFDYKVSFKDNPHKKNYYWISAKGFNTYDGKNYSEIAVALYSNYSYADDFNRLVEEGYGYIYEYEYYIRINDISLNQDSVNCQFYPASIHIMNGFQEIFLLSADYHLDKYMKSSLLMSDIDFYAEEVPIAYSPFPVYSNIHGGTGIFGSLNSVSKVFTKE